jgi:hypothetical protein
MAGINTFFCTSFFENVVVFIVDFKRSSFNYNHCLPM